MIPSHLQVFDGLRITTEHVDHLQAALESSVHDLRAIAGLNRVYRGYDVTAAGPNEVSVGPGLAFDARANRLVLDEPQTAVVDLSDDVPELFVCIGYHQVQAGEVEGVPTLVFDSALVSLQQERPDTDDIRMVLARVMRSSQDADHLQIDDLRPLPPSEASQLVEPVDRTTGVAEGAPPSTGGDAVVPVDGAAAQPFVTRWEQGVVQLEPRGNGSLVARLRTAPNDSNGDTETVLAQARLDVAFAPVSLTVDGLLTLSLSTMPGGDIPAAPTPTGIIVRGVIRGELLVAEPPKQQGLTTIETFDAAMAPLGQTVSVSTNVIGLIDVSELVVRALPSLEPLRPWTALLTVARDEDGGLRPTCSLRWKGALDDETLRVLEDAALVFSCDAVIAWKAIGN